MHSWSADCFIHPSGGNEWKISSSIFLEELDEFEGDSTVKVGSLEDPVSVLLEFGGLGVVDPEVNFNSEALGDLYSHSGDVGYLLLWWYGEGQQQVLPQSVALASFKSQNEGAALLVMFVLPDGLYAVLEKVNVGAFLKFAWSLEVLIEWPEILDGMNLTNWEKTVLEVTFSLNEVLVPELERCMKF